MSEEERFFDILFKTLNYAIEFAQAGGYASLRFTDLFNSLLEFRLSTTGETSYKPFYEGVRERTKARQWRDSQERTKLQGELLQMFIDEWRKKTG